MKRYKDFQPTCFDTKGLRADELEIGEWFVLPVSRTRDSGAFEDSNFESALAILGGESDTVEVHRFGHWGPGWFEIIVVHPSREQDVEAIESRLDDYPVLDEQDYCDREYERAVEYWERMSVCERVDWCSRYRVSIFAARRDEIPDDPRGALIGALAE